MLRRSGIGLDKNVENGSLHVRNQGVVHKAFALTWQALHKVRRVAETLPDGLAIAWSRSGSDDALFKGCRKFVSCDGIECWNEMFLNVHVGSIDNESINNEALKKGKLFADF